MNIQTLVDRLGDINTQLKAFDDLAAERDAIRKQLAEHCDALSTQEETLQGQRFTVVFSKPPVNRAIEDLPAYLEAVGLEGFLQSVKVSTTEAAKRLSKAGANRLFVESRGARRLKAVVPLQVLASPEQAAVTRFYESLSGMIESVSPVRPGPQH